MSEEKIGVSQHNVSINISSNNARLVKYAREHLRGLARQPLAAPDIDVRCQWIEQEWQPEQNPFEGGNGYSFYGKRMLGKRNELIWLNTLRMKGLQLRFRRENGRFLFDIVYSYHPKRENIESQADDEYRKYFNLMNYIFYYPLFWYLENFRNWTSARISIGYSLWWRFGRRARRCRQNHYMPRSAAAHWCATHFRKYRFNRWAVALSML